jgi:hypothetical protein
MLEVCFSSSNGTSPAFADLDIGSFRVNVAPKSGLLAADNCP